MGTPDTSRRYVIISASDLPRVNFDEVLENQEYLRYSIDGSRLVLKYEGEAPSSIRSLTSTFYTLEEISPIIQGIDWTPEEEEGLYD